MEKVPFDLGPDGNIITCPLTGWVVAPVMNSAILARLQYAETEDQLKTGEYKALQLIVTPQQALELAEILTKQAKQIFGQSVPNEKN